MFLRTSLRTLALSLVLALPFTSYASEPPESEIEEIVITDRFPERWTYPDIQPHLIEEAKKRGYL